MSQNLLVGDHKRTILIQKLKTSIIKSLKGVSNSIYSFIVNAGTGVMSVLLITFIA